MSDDVSHDSERIKEVIELPEMIRLSYEASRSPVILRTERSVAADDILVDLTSSTDVKIALTVRTEACHASRKFRDSTADRLVSAHLSRTSTLEPTPLTIDVALTFENCAVPLDTGLRSNFDWKFSH
jgi:hypothetical protein